MINFICENRYLEESVFSYTWVKFKQAHDTDLSPNELKAHFHAEILPDLLHNRNICVEFKDYLSSVKLNEIAVLQANEPNINKDFRLVDFPQLEKTVKLPPVQLRDKKLNKKIFGKPDTTDAEDQFAINISKIKIPKFDGAVLGKYDFANLVKQLAHTYSEETQEEPSILLKRPQFRNKIHRDFRNSELSHLIGFQADNGALIQNRRIPSRPSTSLDAQASPLIPSSMSIPSVSSAERTSTEAVNANDPSKMRSFQNRFVSKVPKNIYNKKKKN